MSIQKIEPGMPVICISNKHHLRHSLQLGELYIITSKEVYMHGEKTWIQVLGQNDVYSTECFIEAANLTKLEKIIWGIHA